MCHIFLAMNLLGPDIICNEELSNDKTDTFYHRRLEEEVIGKSDKLLIMLSFPSTLCSYLLLLYIKHIFHYLNPGNIYLNIWHIFLLNNQHIKGHHKGQHQQITNSDS